MKGLIVLRVLGKILSVSLLFLLISIFFIIINLPKTLTLERNLSTTLSVWSGESSGSGVVIKRITVTNDVFCYYVLTAAHIIENNQPISLKLNSYTETEIIINNVILEKINQELDYALLKFNSFLDIPVAQTTSNIERIDRQAYLISCQGPIKIPILIPGCISQNFAAHTLNPNYLTFIGGATDRASGGGVFNKNHELVGILVSTLTENFLFEDLRLNYLIIVLRIDKIKEDLNDF